MNMTAHWLVVGPLVLALVLTAVERYRLHASDRMLRARLRAMQEVPSLEPSRPAGSAVFARRPMAPRRRFGRRTALPAVTARPMIDGTAVRLHA